jgi:hypothetical protein
MKENDSRTQDVRCVHCAATRPGRSRLIESNEILDAVKIAVEAIFDLGLYVQILAVRSPTATIAKTTNVGTWEWV